MKRKPLQIAGLYLWAVRLSFRDGLSRSTTTLFITTRRRDVDQAITKAEKVAKKYQYVNPNVEMVEERGTLDA